MHYEDNKRWEDQNTLKAVVYKHGILHSEDSGHKPTKQYEYDLMSIQECQYVSPHLVARFIMAYDWFLDDSMRTLGLERYYLVTLKQVDYELAIESISDVTDDPDEFRRLH